MTGTQCARAVCDRLEQVYPDAVCALHYQKPYELMIAARLSAQCTDARVNIVTRTLFEKYPTLESFANAELTELEQDIRPCGFYHTKAQSIIGMCRRILEVYGGGSADPAGYRQEDGESADGGCVRQACGGDGYPLHPHLRTAWSDPT